MIEQEKIEELKARHGADKLAYQAVGEQEFLYKKPSRQVYNRFINESTSNSKKAGTAEAMATLCIECQVYPVTESGVVDRVALATAIEANPGMPMDINSELLGLAGVDETSAKKV